ncbi:MAG TPA: HNH endonuclease [Candidatus Paenibacillus intestinavium]|nr:HNH endonuclease [Candidatus Paenibacillus intestinavium]
MFPKPVKQVKEKKAYSSLQNRKKEKKVVPEWKQNILAHHKSNPSKADRAEFPASVVKELIEETGGRCQCGCGQEANTTHHVFPRGRGGRGVKTNGMRLNGICHDLIQTSDEALKQWIAVYTELHGERFWYDEKDWDEFYQKQTRTEQLESEKKQRLERIDPIIDLLTAASGRKLKAAEIRLIDGMDDKEMSVFANMMSDILAVGAVNEQQVNISFGYGHFND